MLDSSPSLAAADLTGSLEPARRDLPVAPSSAPVRNIAELAAIAGVAVSTVSRSLANKPGVKRETRSRIQQLARLHGFCINTNAQSLRAGKGGERQAVPQSSAGPSELHPDAFTLRLLKTIFDQAIRSGYDVSSRRVEIAQTSGPEAEHAMTGEAMQSLSGGKSDRTPITIHIMMRSDQDPYCGVGYCIELSAQKGSAAL